MFLKQSSRNGQTFSVLMRILILSLVEKSLVCPYSVRNVKNKNNI